MGAPGPVGAAASHIAPPIIALILLTALGWTLE